MSQKSYMIKLYMGAAAMLMPLSLSAAENNEYCSEDMLKMNFPEPFVQNTLEKFNIPSKERVAIVSALKSKDPKIVSLVEEKASKMNPNPLKDHQHRFEAVKLFRETLYQVFSEVMKAHGIDNEDMIQEMLGDLQQQKARQFASCMEKMRSEQMQKPENESKEMNPSDEDDTQNPADTDDQSQDEG